MLTRPGITAALAALAAGRTTSQALTAECFERIDDPAAEGSRVFLKLYRATAIAAAMQADAARASGRQPGALAGIPISIKDLFDVAGETTQAGSVVLRGAAPARQDAVVVARLRAAGAVILGKTNMTEFAYSGIGINPHYGTPLAPYDRAAGRVPGGSSAGAAVSVADAMALGAIGTDTGGSTRIPAAFCGIAGFKPSRGRVPTQGAFPLAESFDSIGPMAGSVADCRLLDRVLSGADFAPRTSQPRAPRLGLAVGLPMSALEPEVARAFDAALARLRGAGMEVTAVAGIDWGAALGAMQDGQLTAVECLAHHGALFARRDAYDPRVAARIGRAVGWPATDYVKALWKMQKLREQAARVLRGFDAVLMPTVACLPPLLSDLADDAAFAAANSLVLRNTSLVNILDGCAISLPITALGEAPVGMMLMAGFGADPALFEIAAMVEAALAARGDM